MRIVDTEDMRWSELKGHFRLERCGWRWRENELPEWNPTVFWSKNTTLWGLKAYPSAATPIFDSTECGSDANSCAARASPWTPDFGPFRQTSIEDHMDMDDDV